MIPSGADFIELFRKLPGQGFGRREAPFEDPVGDVSIAQSHDRCAKDGYSRGRQNEPGGERAFANAARRPIVVRIDGDDPCHARIPARRQHQRDRRADRDADNCRLPNIDLVEVRRRPLVEILGRVRGFWNIRPPVPGIVKGMDREVLLELGNDFLEYVELGSERMQEKEVWAHPSPDAADSYAAEIHIFDGNPGGPDQCCGPLRGRPQGFDDVGEYDQHHEECQEGNQYPGHVHGAIPQLTWPRQQAVARQQALVPVIPQNSIRQQEFARERIRPSSDPMFAIIDVLGTFIVDLFNLRGRLEVEDLFLRHPLNITRRPPPPRPGCEGVPDLAHKLPPEAADHSITRPRWAARATASVRLSASSLARIAATWNLAVWSEIPSRRAITLLEAPSAMAASTSCSRGVSETRLAPSSRSDSSDVGELASSSRSRT